MVNEKHTTLHKQQELRVIMLSSSLAGGAGGAAYRLLKDLKDRGIETQILVEDGLLGKGDPAVILATYRLPKMFKRLTHRLRIHPLDRYPRRTKTLFSPQWCAASLAQDIQRLSPDIVHLHWVCDDWMGIDTLSKLASKPIIWTLHDMWPFTGGCHFNDNCHRYRDKCNTCPQLGSSVEMDLSQQVFAHKKRAWRDLNITVVAPSRWLADCAKASALFRSVRVEVIPNGIDLECFRPFDRRAARELLGLPYDKRIILFGAWSNEHRKGMHLLTAALTHLLSKDDGAGTSFMFVVFGFDRVAGTHELSLPIRYLGRLNDTMSLRAAYAAADVFVIPSMQDNLPTMAIEAIACGTPCVGFRTGGIPDIIEHATNGYLATPFDPVNIACGIEWVLEDEERRLQLATNARHQAEKRFARDSCAVRYEALYRELLERDAGVTLKDS